VGINWFLFQAHVRAFAATNSSKVTKEELEKELDKELEKAIPFILDELDKSDHKTDAQTVSNKLTLKYSAHSVLTKTTGNRWLKVKTSVL
jgi:hypothetical protein